MRPEKVAPNLYYETAGSGQPLVLIHGFTLDCRMWDNQFDTFAGDYRTIRYDARGFGRSPLPGETPYSHSDDLEALLQHLDVYHAILIGFSMGAEIALDFTLANPEKVDALVLAGAFLQGFQWETFGEAYKSVIAKGKASGVQAAKQAWLSQGLFKPALGNPSAGVRIRQMVAEYSGWHFIHKDPKRRPNDSAIENLNQIQTATLVLAGQDDLADFCSIADLLMQHIPQAKRIDIPRSGHFISMEAPEIFNRHVLHFLRNATGR